MSELAKQITSIIALIIMCFSGYFFLEATFAKADDIIHLAQRVDNTDLAVKIIMLERIRDKKRDQLYEAQKAGATELVKSLTTEISDLDKRIEMLEKKAMEDN